MKALTTANKFLRKPVVKQATRILLILLILTAVFCIPVFAEGTTSGGADKKDIWKAGEDMIKDVYSHIATISTALAALMSAVAVIGAKMSNNQHKVDAAWDWLKRIWIAWAIINGIGAFIAYIQPLFKGYNTF